MWLARGDAARQLSRHGTAARAMPGVIQMRCVHGSVADTGRRAARFNNVEERLK